MRVNFLIPKPQYLKLLDLITYNTINVFLLVYCVRTLRDLQFCLKSSSSYNKANEK